MVARRGLAGGEQPVGEPGDGVGVFRVHHDHRALPASELHHLQDLAIRKLQVVVGHIQLERRVAAADERRQFLLEDLRSRVADDEMEGVVDARLAERAPVIVLDRRA